MNVIIIIILLLFIMIHVARSGQGYLSIYLHLSIPATGNM